VYQINDRLPLTEEKGLRSNRGCMARKRNLCTPRPGDNLLICFGVTQSLKVATPILA